MSYPIYSWLSIVGFMILYAKCAWHIFFVRRPFKIELWFGLCFQVVGYVLGFIMLPAAALLFIMHLASEVNEVLGFIINCATFIVLYILGVIATRKLYRWSQENLWNETNAPSHKGE